MVGPPLHRPQTAHYWAPEYVSPDRLVSYSYQIHSILKLNPRSVLEIGIGPGIVTGYLKGAGFDVVACDIEPGLRPDCVGDARQLLLQALPSTAG